jgi:hypothetical protein
MEKNVKKVMRDLKDRVEVVDSPEYVVYVICHQLA